MEVLLPFLYDRPTDNKQANHPTNQQTDMRVQREVALPIMGKWVKGNKNVNFKFDPFQDSMPFIP